MFLGPVWRWLNIQHFDDFHVDGYFGRREALIAKSYSSFFFLFEVSKMICTKIKLSRYWCGTQYLKNLFSRKKKHTRWVSNRQKIQESHLRKKFAKNIIYVNFLIEQKKFEEKISILRGVTFILLTKPKNTKHTVMGFWGVKLTSFNFLRLEFSDCYFCWFLWF